MKAEEIQQDQHIQDFLKTRSIRESTAKQYIKRIAIFCRFISKTPTQLIEEAEDEEDSNIRMKRRNIKKYLTNFLIHLRDNNKSENYISTMMTTIQSFYREYDIELPKIRIKSHDKNNMVTTDDIVKREHILKALDHCNLKYKAIILLMSSSGMGQSEIVNLTYKDFLNAISEYYKPTKNAQFDIYTINQKLQENINDLIGTWQIKRYKTGMPYVTFSTSECIQAILYYLIDRIIQNRPVKSLDDWLFETLGNKLSTNSMVAYFKGLNDRCEFGYVGAHRFFTSHKLRKYFGSTLIKNKMPELTTHWLMGHKIDPVTEAYFKVDIHALKEQYKTVIDDLSIENVILREVTTEGYDKLLKKIEALEKRQILMEKLGSDSKFQDKMSSMKKTEN